MKHLTDDELERSIERVRARELETLSEMLKHLREVDRRKLFSKRGYTSLYDYAIRKLRYSGDQAYRRISAMRLVKDIPEIEEKIVDSSLKLTHLTDAQTLFKKVEHTREEKVQILARLENTTTVEARKVLKQEDQKRYYGFEAGKEFENAVERLRGLHPHLNFDELMEKVCLIALEKLDPYAKAKRIEEKRVICADRSEFTRAARVENKKLKRYPNAQVKRKIWLRHKGKCCKCGSIYALEFDHIKPFALGGLATEKNIQLLCRNCNQRRAIEQFGVSKIEKLAENLR